jgi:nicotinamide-nucleotide amidase
MPSRASVLLVGDEILAGVVRDANVATIARALAERGIPVTRVEVVGDDAADIAVATARLCAESDVLVITGGLGPTDDDRTREGVARALGVGISSDPDWEERIRTRAVRLGHPAPSMISRQATFPEGTSPVENPVGSAPGFRGALGNCAFWVLPGVPAEVRAMMPLVVAALPDPPPDFAWERIVWTVGLSEVRAAIALESSGFVVPEGAALGFLPGPAGVRIKLASRTGVLVSVMDAAEAHVRAALAGHAIPVAPLERAVLEELGARGMTLATAESCTGGLLGAHITDVPGASSVYLGGVVAYANRAKSAQLGVDPEVIRTHGAVSEEVSRAMAEGARKAFGADFAVSVTGVAGPGGGTPVNPVGSVWIAVADSGGADARHFVFPGSREMIRERSVAKALELVWRRVRGEDA